MSHESPGDSSGAPLVGDLDAELDAAFEALEYPAGPPCDLTLVLRGRCFFLVKSGPPGMGSV